LILRRLTEHVKEQNWFAIALDFVIVVAGVFVGMQAQAWSQERDRRKNEAAYLVRLHEEVEQLLATRARYDRTRVKFSADLAAAVQLLNGEKADALLSVDQCDAIAGSAHTTVPPAELPTVAELLSTGRLDQLTSPNIRLAILSYTQEAARARDLILAISDSGRDIGKTYPLLITHHVGPSRIDNDQLWLNPDCQTEAMRADPAFMNEVSENTYMYNVYANRAVLPVSAQLQSLHAVIDAETGVSHPPEPENAL
jgi:hypothetical protein